jgi:protein SCO1/2
VPTTRKELNLPDADGKVRTLADFKGKVVVVFFGYTQCPDVCPTTLAELAAASKLLGADGAACRVFVTVDPERDTPAVLKAYVASFGPTSSRCAARRADKAVPPSTSRSSMPRCRARPTPATPSTTPPGYVFDAQGKVRLFTRYGSGAEALVHDLKSCCRGAKGGRLIGRREGGAGAVRRLPAPCASSSSPPPRSGGCARR